MSGFKDMLKWEGYKISHQGLWTLFSIVLTILYFYSLFLLFIGVYPYLPYQNLYFLYCSGTYSVHLLSYMIGNGFFLVFYMQKSSNIDKWKINSIPWPWEKPEKWSEDLMKLIKNVLFIQLCILPISLSISGLTVKLRSQPEDLSFKEVIWQIAFFTVCEDFLFYWSHRAMHTPWLYKNIHKQHHEYNVSISFAAEYSHPVEYILGNSLPMALGTLILGHTNIHVITWFIWVSFRTVSTADGHCGYDFPWSPLFFFPFHTGAAFHDFHHSKNQGNYGSFFTIWDTICGTDYNFFRFCEKNEGKIKD